MLQMLVYGGTLPTDSDLRMHCPSCRHLVTLATTLDRDLRFRAEDEPDIYAGIRLCPNPECRQLIFIAYGGEEVGTIASYPEERIDFDATNVPDGILKALEEAVSCHAVKCYTAAAMMVRKTLEELCRDRGATGSNLKDRIIDLGSKIVIPQELLDGLDDLRLLGNDAAHIEARSYQQIGKEEVEISLEFTKEILKAVYQYSDLLRRLRSLKKP